MLGLLDILKGYENTGKDYLVKGDRKNASITFKKILKAIMEEGVLPNEISSVIMILRRLSGYFLEMGQYEDSLECITMIEPVAGKKISKVKEGQLFLEKLPNGYDLISIKTKFEKAFNDTPEIMDRFKKMAGYSSAPETSESVPQPKQKVIDQEKVENSSPSQMVLEKDVETLKYELALKQLEIGNEEEAFKILNELVMEFPSNVKAREKLEELKKILEVQKRDESFNQLMVDMQVNDESEKIVLKEMFNGDIAKANEIVTKLLAMNKNNPRLYLIKACVSKKMGNTALFNNFKSYAERLQPTIMTTKLYDYLIIRETI